MKRHALSPLFCLLTLLPACAAIPIRYEKKSSTRMTASTQADRAALYAALDAYLGALGARAPEKVRWAENARYTENNVEMPRDEGLWGTITGIGSYRLRFADAETGQVGYFGTVTEPAEESAFTLRLRVDGDGRIAEAETLVVRQSDSGIKFENPRFWEKPVLNETVAPERRLGREAMIALSDGYFDTLQRNDGTIHTRFHPDCQRVENGVQTTNNPEFAKIVPVSALGCEEQFKTGAYRYDDRLRARRYPLVDEERGLVLAGAFIDHSGRLGEYRLTDGRTVMAPLRRPHSFYILELFKIEDGMIRQIEANFMTVPYFMPSPWDLPAK